MPKCNASTDSCSCTSVPQDTGNGVACPAAGATATLCCADFHYPTYESQSCTCVALRIGCEAGGTYCDCHGTTDPKAVLAATCTKPTGWSMCCKGFASDCYCLANPAMTCIDPVAKCDSNISAGARCALGSDGDCSCSPDNPTGSGTCPPPGPLVCCLNETDGWCRCNPGGTCAAGSKNVPTCTADVVAPFAEAAATCGYGTTRQVKSCSPFAP